MIFRHSPDDYTAQRNQMIDNLLKRKDLSEDVLNAMQKLPREKFVLPAYRDRAYQDTALPINARQTISQPYTVAYMTTLLDVEGGEKVLEIGTGSGYQASLLYLMGCTVYSVERLDELFAATKSLMKYLDIPIKMHLSDGTIGWPDEAPFDRIIVTAAAPEVPKKLKKQLNIGGKMVVPIGNMDSQVMMLVTRNGKNNYETTSHGHFKFVPLIGKDGWDG